MCKEKQSAIFFVYFGLETQIATDYNNKILFAITLRLILILKNHKF